MLEITRRRTTVMPSRKVLVVMIMVLLTPALILPISVVESADKKKTISTGPAVVWREPSDIKTRNLFYGSGGETGLPREPFRFIEEDRKGGSPKFTVEDAHGVHWKVKLGSEAKPE